MKKFNQRMENRPKEICPETRRVLMSYQWPGNVRELENAIEHAFVLVKGKVLTANLLPAEILSAVQPGGDVVSSRPGYVTKENLKSALVKAGWNKAKAARMLGVTRTTVWRNIKKYDLLEETSQEA